LAIARAEVFDNQWLPEEGWQKSEPEGDVPASRWKRSLDMGGFKCPF
jgi:hypothetical protein